MKSQERWSPWNVGLSRIQRFKIHHCNVNKRFEHLLILKIFLLTVVLEYFYIQYLNVQEFLFCCSFRSILFTGCGAWSSRCFDYKISIECTGCHPKNVPIVRLWVFTLGGVFLGMKNIFKNFGNKENMRLFSKILRKWTFSVAKATLQSLMSLRLSVCLSVCLQNPSTAWNHHPSSFNLHPSFILHHSSFILHSLHNF